MQIASSARRTCIASVSAVEWTATVRMPISWQARWMRSAISPRLAMRTLLIIVSSSRRKPGSQGVKSAAPLSNRDRGVRQDDVEERSCPSLDDDERLVGFDGLG